MDNNKDDFSDVMIPYVEFAENANERTPCILVLDCSGSMRGEPIKQLNTGLQALEKELKEDIDASSRVQLLVIKAYGKDDAEISADWVDAMNFTAPIMEASGLSPIGKAMELALQKIEEQKCLYDSCGITSNGRGFSLSATGNRRITVGNWRRQNAGKHSRIKKSLSTRLARRGLIWTSWLSFR